MKNTCILTMGTMIAPWIVYVVQLVVAGIVGAHAMVTDSMVGASASMLLSPLGTPIQAIAPALLAGRLGAAGLNLVTTVASACLLVAIGAGVRVWNILMGGDGTRPLAPATATTEMKKRMVPFDVRSTIAYAGLIGALMAVHASPRMSRTGLGGSNSASRILNQVGMSLAISITVPLVNAGIAYVDHTVASRAKSKTRSTIAGAVRSVGVSACNAAGIVLSGLVITYALGSTSPPMRRSA